MILVEKRKVVGFVGVVLVAVLVVGVVGYRTVNALAPGDSAGKLASERVLYLAIVVSGVVALAALWMLMNHVSFSRQISVAIDVVRREGSLPEERLTRFGRVGERIGELYADLQTRNHSLRNRVDALSQLVQFFARGSSDKYYITDVLGTVLYATKPLRSQSDADQVVGEAVNSVMQGVDFQGVLRTLDRTGEVYEQDGRGFYPITDDRGIITYVVCAVDAGRLPKDVAPRQLTRARRSLIDRARSWLGRKTD